jgi:CotH kinase protein
MIAGVVRRVGGIALIGVALCLAAAPAASAAEADPAAWMYEPTAISEIDLTLPPDSVKALEADPTGEYVPGTFSLAETDGVPGSAGPFTSPIEVGIRLKGSLGSLRTLSEKAAFKIKFDEFVEGQTFLGLKKMTLNNMIQDQSMVHETLAYEAFHALGVPAPNTGFAYLHVNGEDFGLHLNVETLDKVALEKRFGPFASPPQHLYEGEYGADVTPELASEFEVDEGKKKEKGDLEALVAAVAGGSSGWLERVEPFADLAEMTRMWATEKYAGHWDGYSGESGGLRPNNYYLYSDPAGSFRMLPWGTDQTWEAHLDFDGPAGVLFNDCLADAGCDALYRGAATEALQALSALGLDRDARCTAERLAPWQELEASAPRHPYSAGQIAASVEQTREFVSDRPAELAGWLGVATPVPPPDEPSCPPLHMRKREEPPAPTPTPVESVGTPHRPDSIGKPPALFRLRHIALVAGVLKAHLKLPVPGRLALRAAIGSSPAGPYACKGSAEAAAAGPVVVSCPLSTAARRKLEAHWLQLSLQVAFRSRDGVLEGLTRTINLPRQ